MLIIKNKFGKGIIAFLMNFNVFNRCFAVLSWGNHLVVRRTKPIGELMKNEIREDNIFTLKFKYHSSHSVLDEYIAEIETHNFLDKKVLLNIWSNELKIDLIKQSTLELTEETNSVLRDLLEKKVFKEKYGNNYNYFISLYLEPDIIKARENERKFSEVTIKYSLKREGKKIEMRHKSKFNISKLEAQKLSSMISYWKA